MIPTLLLAVGLQSLPIESNPDFPFMDLAAVGALSNLPKYNVEFAGGIYKCGEVYHYTSPVTSNQDNKVTDLHLFYPTGCKLVALYHNHPSDGPVGETADQSQYFSETDINTATKMKVTSYILVCKENKIHKLTLGKKYPRVWLDVITPPYHTLVTQGEVL